MEKSLSWLTLIFLRAGSQRQQQSGIQAYNRTAHKLGPKLKPSEFILKKVETL